MLRTLIPGVITVAFALPAHAGVYADDLSRCLVDRTTTEDKNALVRWVITTTTLHPAVQPIARVSPEARDRANRDTARIFERLLTESCLDQTRLAVKYEGAAAIQAGFQTLGQVAMTELFADPKVTEGLNELDKQIDGNKLREALKAK
ncbi:MAG: hypothetical protein AB1593_02515 [Pseudomonadota bacterium]